MVESLTNQEEAHRVHRPRVHRAHRACRPRAHRACRACRVVVYYGCNHILTNQEVLWWEA